MLKIIIADDHAIVRKGLVQILALESSLEFSLIDEAESGDELLSKVRKNEYDLIILDLSMPGKSGLDTLKEIKIEKPNIPILILTTYSEEQYAIRVLRAGASGYVRKTNSPNELMKSIKSLTQGRKYFSQEVAEKILDIGEKKLPHETLSDREHQILCMLAISKTQKEIAEELCLSIKTISTYRKRILEKMGMKNNNELTEYCIQNKLPNI